MSDLSRRDVLQRLAAAMAASAAFDVLDAQAAHHAVAQASTSGGYAAKALSAHELATLERLTDLIIPADHKPGALQAGVAAWIDTLLGVNGGLKAKYVAGPCQPWARGNSPTAYWPGPPQGSASAPGATSDAEGR